MGNYLMIILGTALVNNVVLVKFLGLCPFMGVSNKLDSALGMGLATTFVLTLAAVASWLMEHLVLQPLDLGFLRILTFILVIAAVVQFTEMAVRKISPALYQVLGIFLPLITTNCAVLGVALLNIQEQHSFLESVVYGFGSALGFTLVMVMFAGMRERLALHQVPAAFSGTPIAFVAAGLLSSGLHGLCRAYRWVSNDNGCWRYETHARRDRQSHGLRPHARLATRTRRPLPEGGRQSGRRKDRGAAARISMRPMRLSRMRPGR